MPLPAFRARRAPSPLRWILLLASPVAAALACTSSATRPDDEGRAGAPQAGDAGAPGAGQGGAPAGEAGAGDGGTQAGGGNGGNGGDGGALVEPAAGAGGETTLPPAGCTTDDECAEAQPICDTEAGECRGCNADAECADQAGPRCAASGACVECVTNAHCSAAKPVCTEGTCRPCAAHDECSSLACDLAAGQCFEAAGVVYALAQTGVGSPCGTRARPCGNLENAAAQLSPARRALVLIPTTAAFQSAAALPAVEGLYLVGNDVPIVPYDGTGLRLAGGSLRAEGLRVSGVVASPGSTTSAALTCTGGAVSISNSSFAENDYGIFADDCDVEVQASVIRANDTGILTGCSAASCTSTTKHALTVERTLFESNVHSIDTSADPLVIRNNVFLRNGYGGSGYSRSVRIFSNTGSPLFAYNTLVENSDTPNPTQCSYVGIVVCNGSAPAIISSNLSYRNFPGNTQGSCLSTIYSGCDEMTDNLISEITYPGPSNITADPQLSDPENDDFTPRASSPAIDRGDPSHAPEVDFFGAPRPRGDAPDIGAIEGG